MDTAQNEHIKVLSKHNVSVQKCNDEAQYKILNTGTGKLFSHFEHATPVKTGFQWRHWLSAKNKEQKTKLTKINSTILKVFK